MKLLKHWPLLCILVVFAAIQTQLFFLHDQPYRFRDVDGIGYLRMADSSLWEDQFHGVGYPLAIRAIKGLGFESYAAAKLVSRLSGIAFIILSWMIFRAFSTARIATIGAALVAFSPIVIERSHAIMSDMFGAAMFLATVAFLLIPSQPRCRHLLFAGACAGVAFLTRFNNIVLIASPLLLIAFWGQWNFRKATLGVLGFAFGFVIFSSPWLLHVRNDPHVKLLGENYRNVAFAVLVKNQDYSQFQVTSNYRNFWDFVSQHPIEFRDHLVHNLLVDFPGRAATLVVGNGMLTLIGLAALTALLLRHPRRSAFLPYLLMLIPHVALVTMVWVHDRYLLPLVPLLAFAVAMLLGLFPTQLRRWRIPIQAPLMIGLAILQTGAIRVAIQQAAGDPLEYGLASEWLYEHAERNSRILTPENQMLPVGSFRSERFGVKKPGIDASRRLHARLTRQDFDYLVFDERRAAIYFPQLAGLLNPATNPLPDLLEPVFVLQEPKALVIYRVHGQRIAKLEP